MNNPGPSLLRGSIRSFLAILLIFAMASKNGRAEESDLPFQPGERLTFQLRWGLIPAGEAVLEVLPVKVINGVNCYHFVLTAKTNPVVDAFYKVRNRIESFTDTRMTHSVLHRQKKREGKTEREVEVVFDWDKNQAQYSNFNKKSPPISIYPGSFDPLSALYYARLLELSPGAELRCPVTDGKKSIIGTARVKQREKITIAGITYEAFLMEPELEHVGGVFEKSRDAKIRLWVTADSRKIPLRIKSKVVVGHFIGELSLAEGLK